MLLHTQKAIMSHPWYLVYEGEGEDEAAKAAAAALAVEEAAKAAKIVEDEKNKGDESFTQDQVNKMLADDRRKHQAQTQTALDELDAIKAKAELSETERTDLETRMSDMRRQLMTKEELAKEEREKITKVHQTEVETLTTDRDAWKHKYTESTIVGSIIDAAAKADAFDPDQIVAILRPTTQLAEELDSEGKPTNNLVPKVSFSDVDKDGKTVTLDLDVESTVKRMKELERFGNLFKSGAVGGLGGANKGQKGGTGGIDAAELAKTDPAKYRELRKSGKITL